MRIADTIACELAQQAWVGVDAPGDPAGLVGIRVALERGLPGEFTLEDVIEWAQPAVATLLDAGDRISFEARLVGCLTSALILGARLQETSGT